MRHFNNNKISIILPSYNEVKNISKIIQEIQLNLKNKNFEVIIIDDNSEDNTSRSILKKFSKNKNIILVQREFNRSLIKSIKMGLQISTGEVCVVMDSDGQHSIDDFNKMLKKIKNKDIIIGVRNLKEIEFLSNSRKYLSTFFNWYLSRILNFRISDPLTGFFIFKSKLLNKKFFEIESTGFKVLLDLLYSTKNKKLKIEEHTVVFKKRKFGKTKLNISVFFSFLTQILSFNLGCIFSPPFIGFLLIGLSGFFIYFFIFLNSFYNLNINYNYSYIISAIFTTFYNFNLNNLLNYFERKKFFSLNYFSSITKYYIANIPGLIIGLNIAIILKDKFFVNLILATIAGSSIDSWFKYYVSKIWIFK
jgi:dolichol-phosphate mannosyltransferase